MTSASPARVLLRTLALVASHPTVSKVEAPSLNEASGITTVDVTFEVNLPNEWRQYGESPSGVRLTEVVRFDFPERFPTYPPELSLRADFNRNLPHMQPFLIDGRSVPCIYDGSLVDLFYQDGMVGIVNQTAVWLERAALGTLIDPKQGWEPVRRDSFQDYLVADADGLTGLVNRNGGHKFCRFQYLKIISDGGLEFVHGQILADAIKLNSRLVPNIFGEILLDRNPHLYGGKSLALVVWPGKRPSGELIVNDTYLPETVGKVDDLKERAALYGCARELDEGLKWLKRCLSKHPKTGSFALAIVLLARRPFNVIGSDSPIELCPYVVNCCSPNLFANGSATTVRPAAHHHAVTRPLLVQMTGGEVTAERSNWTLLGAGSLGSKLALHLARAGNGPEVILDKSGMTPHNAARHALIPEIGDMQLRWMGAKARILCEALRGLDQKATPIIADAVNALLSKGTARRTWSKSSWAVVNATASLIVRDALAATDLIQTRVIETALFASGRIGMITVEGPNRNPNTADLTAEYYALLQEAPSLASIIFDRDEAVSRQNIGQGCGSLTMAMSDGRLSLFAAGMAEYLLARQRDGLPPDVGEVLIGRLSEDGLGLNWHITQVPPVVIVPATMDGEVWGVHIHQRATTKIQEETARWPHVETGGVLMGRLSEVCRTIHVVDVLDPPEDSTRSASEFILGMTGLHQQMETYSDTVGWSLYCVGTWHSHLSSTGPSATDRATAKAVSLARLTPSTFLIHTPNGFRALLVDAKEGRLGDD